MVYLIARGKGADYLNWQCSVFGKELESRSMSGANETSSMSRHKNDNNYSASGLGSPDSVASDATPVTNNAAVTTKKRNGNHSLHSLWEYKSTSLTGNDDRNSPTKISTVAVSPDASADEKNNPGKSRKSLVALEANKLVSTSSSSLHETAQPRKSVKEEAKKFEVGKKKSEDELILLKKELGKLRGEEVESEKDTSSLQAVQENKTFQFWQQKSKNTSPVAKNESTSYNKTVSTESPRGDFVVADALAGPVTVAATATAATEVTSDAANAKENTFDNNSITSGDSAQLMSEFRALIEKLVQKGKLFQLS